MRFEGLPEDDLSNLPLRGYYWFGSSTSNVKIEGWWRQLIVGQTLSWIISYKDFGLEVKLTVLGIFSVFSRSGALRE
jgi:hypothetical protein